MAITLKTWNKELTYHQRRNAVRYIFPQAPESFIEEYSEEWHHNLDAKHQLLIDYVYKLKDGSFEVRPKFSI